jgi:hypothetical protein
MPRTLVLEWLFLRSILCWIKSPRSRATLICGERSVYLWVRLMSISLWEWAGLERRFIFDSYENLFVQVVGAKKLFAYTVQVKLPSDVLAPSLPMVYKAI